MEPEIEAIDSNEATVQPEHDTSTDTTQEETHALERTDIFLWANNTDGIKNDLDVEFFLFNKNYTPFITHFASELNVQIKPLFLYDLINFVNLGAGTGLTVRDYEQSEGEENTLLRTDLEKVGRAETLIHLIENERHDIVEFSEEEHEFKRIKGVVARFSRKDDPKKVFYSIKAIQQNNVLKGTTAWEFREGKFGSFQADVGLKMPDDNQVLIVDKDIFVFHQSKFEKLFNYEFKKLQLADQKVEEIEKLFKLSFPDGLDLQSLVREKKKVFNKLQKMEIGGVTQEQAIEYADEMQLELMTDDAGAIIIMDGNDLDTFVNLINEDYITSQITGKRYEIKSKKLLDDAEGEPPRG
jgi:hypothetical protein